MRTRMIMIGVVAVGATALGGVYLLTGGQSGEPADDSAARLADARPLVGPDYFTPPETAPAPERGEISTAGQTGGQQNAGGGWREMMDRMSEFDTDGDGILSDEERREMMRTLRDEMLARFDLDGDGELSREERMAMRREMFEQSPWGQDLMRQFDADGNGVLDETEQAAMEAHQRAEREQRRQEQLEQYDLDGDGNLSRDERQAQREEQRERWGDRLQEATNEFDRDGDGQLSIEESQEAWDTYMQRREIDEFVSRYDRDGNGSMGAADYDAFLSDYSRGDSSADVNRDGEVNSMDLAAYMDMVTRSRNRP